MGIYGFGHCRVVGKIDPDVHCTPLRWEEATMETTDQVPVLVLSVWHFAGAERDAIKFSEIDVMSNSSQRQIPEVARSLATFNPTHVLVESHPDHSQELDDEYQRYLKDESALNQTETHQLGFRIAKFASVPTLHGIDEWGPVMKFGELMAYMEQSDHSSLENFKKRFDDFQQSQQQSHSNHEFLEILKQCNTPGYDQRIVGLYMGTNAVGAGENFIGADATAMFWHRNFRMYGNIQQHFAKGTRILVIVGASHGALFRDFVHFDPDARSIDILDYLPDAL
ncbi:MAG: DUF5694 domain-containing protein [Pseudomonadota bacterium]